MTKREIYNKLVDDSLNIRHRLIEEITNICLSKNGTIDVPENIQDYVFNEICYLGGNHPEYASNCFARFETIKYDETTKDLLVYFEDGYYQDLTSNCTDDLFVVLDVILQIEENNL